VKVEVARKGGVRKTYSVQLQRVPEKTELASGGDSGGSDNDDAASMPVLGLSVAPLDRATARQFSIPGSLAGVIVTDVKPDGPAAQSVAGPGNGGPDVILSIEGKPVRSPQDLRSALAGMKAGDIVTLRIYNAQAKSYRIERLKLESRSAE
jgi:serine protease Do